MGTQVLKVVFKAERKSHLKVKYFVNPSALKMYEIAQDVIANGK